MKTIKSFFGECLRISQGKSSWTYSEAWQSFVNRRQSDPFSRLRSIAEMDLQMGLPSIFYIMTTTEKHPLNINDYNVMESAVRDELKTLITQGVEIGLHPGFLTYNDETKLRTQKEKLESAIGKKVIRSRQHYLKYEYPTTFKLLHNIGIENDSSILVNLEDEMENLKKSTYTMQDVSGNSLGITQTPLVFMDTHHMTKSDDEILSILEKSVAPAKKHGGEVMVLWHNNNISNEREVGLYREALEVIKV